MANVVEFLIIGTDKSKRAFKGVTSSIKAVAKVAAVAAAAVVGAGTAVFLFSKKVADSQTILKDWTARIGGTVEELSELRVAAELSNVGVEQMTVAMQRATRRIAEAAKGSGEAQAAIKELGLDARALANQAPAQQMRVLADAMQQVEGQSNKTRLAFKLFDAEGVQVLQTMRNGAQGFDDAAAAAAKYGIVVGTQAASNSELFGEQMTRVGFAMRGVSQGIGNQLIPLIAGLAKQFSEFISRNREDIVNFVGNVIDGFFIVIATARKVGEIVGDVFSALSPHLCVCLSFSVHG